MQIAILASLASIFFATPQLLEEGRTNTEQNDVVNGVETKKLNDLIKQLKKDPKIGQVTFFSDTSWQGGMKSMTTISSFMIDGVMKGKNRKFTLMGDGMKDIGGTDTAPDPIEELMYALGTCITATANLNAALMGVKLTKIEVLLKGDVDMHGVFGLDPNVRPGVLKMETTIKIAGDAEPSTLKIIAMKGFMMSPVSDTVHYGAKVYSPPNIVVE